MELALTSRVLVPPTIDVSSARAFQVTVERAPGRVVVLEGTDDVFCRGMDLRRLAEPDGNAGVAVGLNAFVACVLALRRSARPVVALVDGEALGGGVGLAAACDLVVATERARFGLPEGLLGLVPGAVLPLLCERVARQKARLLALTGGAWSAREAHAHGLVDVLTADERGAEDAVRRGVRSLARCDPRATTVIKALTEPQPLSLEESVVVGGRRTAEAIADPNVVAAVRAFVEEGASPWDHP